MLLDSRQSKNKTLALLEGLKVLVQPVDKAICETGDRLPRFPSRVSSVLAQPRFCKRGRKVVGLLKVPPPQTHMQRAGTATHTFIDPGLRW